MWTQQLTLHEALLHVDVDVRRLGRLELALQALEVVLARAVVDARARLLQAVEAVVARLERQLHVHPGGMVAQVYVMSDMHVLSWRLASWLVCRRS